MRKLFQYDDPATDSKMYREYVRLKMRSAVDGVLRSKGITLSREIIKEIEDALFQELKLRLQGPSDQAVRLVKTKDGHSFESATLIDMEPGGAFNPMDQFVEQDGICWPIPDPYWIELVREKNVS